VCPNTPSISVPIGAAADAILRQKEKAQTEKMQRKDNAKKKATELLAGKTVKRPKKKIKGVDNDDDDTNGVGQDDGENNHGKGEF